MSHGFSCIKNLITSGRSFLFRNKQLRTVSCAIRFINSDLNSSYVYVVDRDTIQLLERLSLVNFEDNHHIAVLEDAIKFADKISDIDTNNVEPLVSVLEQSCLRLRPDQVTEGDCRASILMNAAVTEEDYFVAPPGNIPLDSITATNKQEENTTVNITLSCKSI